MRGLGREAVVWTAPYLYVRVHVVDEWLMGQVRSEATIGRRGTGEITFHGGKKYVSAPMAPPRTVVGAFGSFSSRELQYPGSSGPAQAFPNTQTAEAKRQREIEERRVSVLPCALGILHREIQESVHDLLMRRRSFF